MPSESGNRSGGAGRAQQSMGFPPPPQTEPLPCPRCDSLNTKFCYYNNYNLSQPRHFCKSCRRYWTHGGTLRDVPVGGGSRKNSRRSRYHSSSTASSSSSSSTTTSSVPILPGTHPETNHNNLNDPTAAAPTGTFTSLLTSQGSGFLALGGYGSAGPGPGPAPFDEMGFALGRGSLWATTAATATPYPEVVGDLLGNYAAGGPPETSSSGYNTWQIDAADAGRGVIDGDFLGWPDLAISMQGKSLK